MKRKIRRGVLILVFSCIAQFVFTSCEEENEIFDNIEHETDEHNEKKQKPGG